MDPYIRYNGYTQKKWDGVVERGLNKSALQTKLWLKVELTSPN